MKFKIGTVVVALLALLAVLTTLSVSNAAALSLTRPSITTVTADGRCTVSAGAVAGPTTNGLASTVVLSGLSENCAKKQVSLTLYGSNGASLGTVSEIRLPAALAGSAVVAVPAFRPAEVAGLALTVGSWAIPAAWTGLAATPAFSCHVPGRSDVTCTVTVDTSDIWNTGFNRTLTISTSPAVANADWRLKINLADPIFPQPVRALNGNAQVVSGWTCGALPIVDVQALSWNRTGANGKVSNVYMGGATTGSGTIFTCP